MNEILPHGFISFNLRRKILKNEEKYLKAINGECIEYEQY